MFHKHANKLSDEQKIYVVTRLAEYKTPNAIARELKENFGIEVTPQCINNYHPERTTGLGQRWKDLFWEARKAYLVTTANIGAMQPAVRMRWREDMVHEAWDAGDYRMANQLLDSIAKEAGAAFETRRKHGRLASPDAGLAATIVFERVDGTTEIACQGDPGGPVIRIGGYPAKPETPPEPEEVDRTRKSRG
jgi:hypothetical protein